MKRFFLIMMAVVTVASFVYLIAADHVDAPAVGSLSTGSTIADITDYYAFESPSNADNYVFVCNVMGLTAPSASGDASFDEDVMYEFNIDNDTDNVEDQVIQAIFRDDNVIVFGPVAPGNAGTTSMIAYTGPRVEAAVSTYGNDPEIGEANGMKVFAGPRDDPFFMDFFRFADIVNGAGAALDLDVPDPADGQAYATSFQDPGMDAFAGTNVMSIVVEVPKSMIGDASTTTFNSWLESKRKK
jgi:hypothetical protein